MRAFTKYLLALALLSAAALALTTNHRSHTATAQSPATAPARHQSLITFSGPPLSVTHRDPLVQYDFDPAHEKFFLHFPSNFNPSQTCGLIVFMHSASTITDVPPGWAPVLDQHHILFIAPQDAGNEQQVNRRLGLALLAVAQAAAHYPIDPRRTFVAGFSGGTRIAGTIAFYHPEFFRGTIQSCGSNFPGPVTRHYAPPNTDAYGAMDATPDQIQAAKSVRFVLITGPRDFRYGYLRDIYESGFLKNNFPSTLLDIPDMPHTICDGATLQKALDFIEQN